MQRVTFKALFDKLRDDTVVNRCEQYAYWSLPYLMADQREVTSSGRVVVERDFQEAGALLTNNLAAKLVRILFPTQYAFFKASASPKFIAWAATQGISKADLTARFARLEMESKDRLFTNSGYASLILALKYLIITGNVLMYRDSASGTITVWGLNCFASRRDGTGKLLDCVLREFTVVEALPEDLQEVLRAGNRAKYSRPEQSVEKYTRIHRTTRNGVVGFTVAQEVDSFQVGDETWYPEMLCPWLCPTWTLIPGEHYGRGMVEDYAGGFAKLSSLSEAGALYGVEMSKVLHLVGAGSGTDIDAITGAESGEFVRADPATVQAYEAGDAAKFAAIYQQIDTVFGALARAFMYTANTRQAERVTMYELQQLANEAELTLGGVYSTLSGGIQVPLAHILMTEVSGDALTGFITGELRPDVTAGIPALGRSSDVQNLLLFAQEAAAVAPLAQVDKRIDPQRVNDLLMAGRSIDPTSVFYSDAEMKAKQEAEASAEAAQAALIQGQTLAQSGDQIASTLAQG